MKTIEFGYAHRQSAVAAAMKQLGLILAGGAALTYVLILLQPLSHIRYRHDSAAASPLAHQRSPGNTHPRAAIATPAFNTTAPPAENPPPPDNKSSLYPDPDTLAAAVATDTAALTQPAKHAFRPTAQQLHEAAAMQAFMEENNRRNDSIVRQLALAIDMQECHFDRASSEPVCDSLVDSSVAKCLRSPASWSRIIVLGFTDNRGNPVSNIRLGMERAEKLKAILVGKGLSADRISTASFGPALPIDNNNTESGRARNRRAELNVLGQASNAGL